MQLAETTFSLGNIWQSLVRHRIKVGVFFGVGMLIVVVVIAFWPATYRSQAQLIVRLGRENVAVDPTATIGQTQTGPSVPQSLENEINSAVAVLKNQNVAQDVVKAIGPLVILGKVPYTEDGPPTEFTPEEQRRAATKFSRALDVEAIKKSNIILITYDAPSPELARAVVGKVIEMYLDRNMSLSRAPKGQQFLMEKTASLHARLKQTEKELRDCMNDTGVSAPEAQRQIYVVRIGRLQDELLEATTSQAAIQAEVNALQEKLSTLAETHAISQTKGVPSPGLDVMRGQLYTLQLKRLELLSKFTEQNPEVQLLQGQIDSARALLTESEASQQQVTIGPSKVYEDAKSTIVKQEATLASLDAKIKILSAQIDDEQEKLKTFNKNFLLVSELQRDLDLQMVSYKESAESLKQTKIDHDLHAERISNIGIAQPATYEPEPTRSRWLLYFPLGLLLALGSSLGLALALNRWDPVGKHA